MVDDRDDGSGDTINDERAPTLHTPPLGVPSIAVTHAVGSTTRPTPMVDLEARYKLGEVLGRGGMGEVVAAFDEQIGREVAVKRVRAEQPSGEQVARFLREARVQGRLEHPAVVPVHDIAVDRAGRPFFVMKRLAGTDMAVLLARLRDGHEHDPAAARRRLLRALADVCLAVELAHNRGIVHRDLKPANIMLGEYGEVYVIDWGIARAVGDAEDGDMVRYPDLVLDVGATRDGAILGTPAYMAPEQLLGVRAGPAADVYALGCILYEIVAGVPLHGAVRTIVSAVLQRDAKPSQHRADAPPELDAICTRATAPDPEQRTLSARALANAIQAFLDGDRDIEVRRELARAHVAEARSALARGGGELERSAAMRAAGRALALDPTATDAAELVGHLMLEPPVHMPVEVERELEAIDIATGRDQGRIGAVAMTGYLWFIPLLGWTGIRDARVVAAFAVFAVLSAAQIYWMTRKTVIPDAAIYTSAVINAVLIGLVCRLVGPFIIAPTLVLTTLMAYAVHPRFGRIGIVAGVLTLGVAVPWVLEAAGVLAPTYRFDRGTLVLDSPAIAFEAVPVHFAFAVLLALLAAVVAVLLRGMASRQREATRQIELQAWHLRQTIRR
jgi:serine/threonine-protein kinase